MPYDLHIVRTEDWTQAASNPITKQDVDVLITEDSELAWSATDYVEIKDQAGTSQRYSRIIWRGQPCFWWYRDQIQCANPDEAQIAKLVQMARALGARAVSDDGKTYPLNGETTSSSLNWTPPPPAKSWPLWTRLVIAFLFGCVLLALKT